MDYAKPILLVSACLGFGGLDLHGQKHKSLMAEDLKAWAEIKPVCPEAGMGLKAPRAALRIVRSEYEDRLIQPQSGTDFSENLSDFSFRFLKNIKHLDGCILKNRSPTCGIRDVKIFKQKDDDVPYKKGRGLFTNDVILRFPDVLIEDEKRLTNQRIRDNFLTVVFTKADLRRVEGSGEIKVLADFHERNRLLLMSYNKTRLREMDKLMNQANLSFDTAFSHYEVLLNGCLNSIPRMTSHKNVLQAAFSSIAPMLGLAEIEFYNQRLELFENEKLSLDALKTLIRSYIVRFSDQTLRNQTYFAPYPEELSTIRDSKK